MILNLSKKSLYEYGAPFLVKLQYERNYIFWIINYYLFIAGKMTAKLAYQSYEISSSWVY